MRLEFAASEAGVRTFQPLRLTADLPGPERELIVRLVLPPGARVVRPLDHVRAGGGRSRVEVLNILVPADAPAGEFVVTGEARDDSRVWPLRAALRVRASPALRVAEPPAGSVTAPADGEATNAFTLANPGNTPLELTLAAPPAAELTVRAEPAAFTLQPGESRAVEVTVRPARRVATLWETPVFIAVESRQGRFVQRDTLGFEAAFVPAEPDPGPLFAQLEGEVLGGVLADDRSGAKRGFAGRLALAGDIGRGLRLELSGADGRSSGIGSRSGLGDRDFARAALRGDWGRVAGGLVSPPSFGILEPVTQGRGGLVEVVRGSWSFTTFGTRDAFADFAREHVGLHARQPEGDWELGVLVQRNELAGSPETRREGGYVLKHWQYGGLGATTQLAAAREAELSGDVRTAGEQRLEWQDGPWRLDGSLQLEDEGFSPAGRSSRRSDGSLSWRESAWTWEVRGVDSRTEGALRTAAQRLRESGRPAELPAVLELITRTTSRQRTLETGFARDTDLGRFGLGIAHDEYRTELDRQRDYREDSAVLDWSHSLPGTFARATLTGGRESFQGGDTDFVALDLAVSGQWGATLSYALNLQRTWDLRGFSPGLRRPGLHGQASVNWQRRPDASRIEVGLDGHDFERLQRRMRTFALVEVPVGRALRLGVEASVESGGGPRGAWVFARIPLRVPVPWRPVRGALLGRLHDGRGDPVPGALADFGGRRALTAADGRFVLPAMPPGRYPLHWKLPAGWTAGDGWPAEAELRAGERQYLDLSAARLSRLQGTVRVRSDVAGAAPRSPDGAVSATDEAGRVFEAPVTGGAFQLNLPPGRYTVRFEGEVSEAVAAQLVTSVHLDAWGGAAAVELSAVERQRKMRQTLSISDSP